MMEEILSIKEGSFTTKKFVSGLSQYIHRMIN